MCVSTSNGLNCQPTTGKNTEMMIKVLTSTTTTTNDASINQLVNIVGLSLKLQLEYIFDSLLVLDFFSPSVYYSLLF
jgi:hypothetical protein